MNETSKHKSKPQPSVSCSDSLRANRSKTDKELREMLRINAKIEKMLARDRANSIFGKHIAMEKADWFNVHIVKRMGLIEITRGLTYGYEF